MPNRKPSPPNPSQRFSSKRSGAWKRSSGYLTPYERWLDNLTPEDRALKSTMPGSPAWFAKLHEQSQARRELMVLEEQKAIQDNRDAYGQALREDQQAWAEAWAEARADTLARNKSPEPVPVGWEGANLFFGLAIVAVAVFIVGVIAWQTV